MHLKAITSSLLLSSLAAAMPLEAPTLEDRQTTSCAPIHLLVARGSTEQPGDGQQLQALARRIVQANPGSDQEAIDYPAALGQTTAQYGQSVSTGTKAVQNQLTAYVNRCPNAKIVLIGYSQGAQIIGDALCGGDSAGNGPVTPAMDSAISSHVTAIVWYGDPRRVAGKSFDKGTATASGQFARPESQSCDAFASKIGSYCDRGDPFCASGNQLFVHLSYNQRYDQQAAAFVQGLVR